jgi:predicted methyltransferase
MTRKAWVSAVAALALGASAATAFAAALPPNISAALADKSRPAADVERDAARHPGELLAWAGVKPGQTVADFIIGGGYFTRILSAAVGPKGHVVAYQPGEFIRFQANYGVKLKEVGQLPNVTTLDAPLSALDLPDGLDLVLTVQNYHDMHLGLFPADTAARTNAEVFKSLKPGGVYVIVDHVGPAGYGVAQPQNGLHRIDPAIVRKEVEAAGFRYDGETRLLADPADPHTANVFAPEIRGKTDQFAMKFRKPK